MEEIIPNFKLFTTLFSVSVICTVMFSEIIKSLDKKDYLKGYRVWLPFVISCGFASAIKFVCNIDWVYMIFVESAMFGFSVFGYEVFLKTAMKIVNKINDKIDVKLENSDEKKE